MLGSPKTKARYQNLVFKKRLKEASSFRRPVRRMPQNKWEFFLSKIGLGTWLSKAIALAIIFLGIYFIYIPNPLFVKNIAIIGLNNAQQQKLSRDIYSYLHQNKIWPQGNLLLLSKKKLQNWLLKKTEIYKVNKIAKDFPNTLNLEVQPRLEKFLVEYGDKQFIVSNDGLILNEVQGTTTQNSLLEKIKLVTSSGLPAQPKLLPDDVVGEINLLQKNLPGIIGQQLAYMKYKADDYSLIAVTASDYKILFEVEQGFQENIDHLKLLFSQISPSDRSRLYSVDLRIKNRGYVCYKNTPCAAETVLNQASSTLQNLLNQTP